MIIFTKIWKSIHCSGFITQNVHPASICTTVLRLGNILRYDNNNTWHTRKSILEKGRGFYGFQEVESRKGCTTSWESWLRIHVQQECLWLPLRQKKLRHHPEPVPWQLETLPKVVFHRVCPEPVPRWNTIFVSFSHAGILTHWLSMTYILRAKNLKILHNCLIISW